MIVEKCWEIEESLPIEVKLKVDSDGYCQVLVPKMEMTWETFVELFTTTDVHGSYYDYENGEAMFTADNIEQIYDWESKHKNLITLIK
jgi:hypothetical protein